MASSSTSSLSVFLFLSLVCGASLASEDSRLHEVNIKQLRWFPQGECTHVYSSDSEKEFSEGGSVNLMHKLSPCSPYRQQNFTTASFIQADRLRHEAMFAKKTKYTTAAKDIENAPVGPYAAKMGAYVIEAGFGTPKQLFYPLIDTGSVVAWLPCKPCRGCGTQPRYRISRSATAKTISCNDNKCSALGKYFDACDTAHDQCYLSLSYGDLSHVNGPLYSDTLSLSPSQTFSDFAFGCAQRESTPTKEPMPGILGLGKGNLSLLTQTRSVKFSYCLPSYNSQGLTGTFTLGSHPFTRNTRWTRMVPNSAYPTFYYVKVRGISVDGNRLSIPKGAFKVDQKTGRGLIVDSGSTVTYLVPEAFNPLNYSFSRRFGFEPAKGDLDSCFRLPGGVDDVRVPAVTIHLQHMDLELTPQQILVPSQEDASVLCLAFVSSASEISILGNVQQQDTLVAFDLSNKRIGFTPRKCGV